MKINQVIDLSHPLYPGREARTLEISRLDATQITGAPEEEGWYIMHRVVMNNHLGTHLEVPYHILESGADLAQIPAEQYIGEAVILDLRGYDASMRASLWRRCKVRLKKLAGSRRGT